jgi:ABC-type glycerol-3-phosphate transport system substrate-binding protein
VTQRADSGKISRRQFLRRSAAAGALLGGVGISGALGACSAGEGSGGNPRLTFWKSPHGEEAKLWKPLLKEFGKQHPNIEVAHNVVPWDSVDESFTAAFTSGEPPDVFYLPDEWFPKYASQGQLADLTDEIGDLKDEYEPNLWEGGTYEGKVYGVPFLAVIQTLLINMTMFEEAGLRAPQSWEEIRTAADRLTDTSKSTYGLAFGSSSGSPNYLAPLLANGGARILSEDLSRVAANTPGGVASWEMAFEKISAEDGSVVPLSFSDDQLTDLQLKGRVGMMWSEQSSIKAEFRTQAPDMKLDVVPLPAIEGYGGQQAVWTNVGYMFMAANTPHPEEALDLLKFLSSKHVQEEYVIKGVDLLSPMKGVESKNPDPIVEKFLSYPPLGVLPEVSVH